MLQDEMEEKDEEKEVWESMRRGSSRTGEEDWSVRREREREREKE